MHEVYENSDALLAHMEHLGDLIGELNELGTMSVELFGTPSPELKEAMDESNTTFYPHMQGL